MSKKEIETRKALQIVITESEEIVLMEALSDYTVKIATMPESLERYFKGIAGKSLLEKIGMNLYGY